MFSIDNNHRLLPILSFLKPQIVFLGVDYSDMFFRIDNYDMIYDSFLVYTS
uniref:Uncharacterized protein n=1 Tax=Helianthus annuus TaxID=4232 RepID=A0A251SFW5_HELAN